MGQSFKDKIFFNLTAPEHADLAISIEKLRALIHENKYFFVVFASGGPTTPDSRELTTRLMAYGMVVFCRGARQTFPQEPLSTPLTNFPVNSTTIP
jgi:hypothetical protein